MSDACGQSRALTVLTRVEEEERLLAALARFPEGPRSPLAGLPATHFGRWVVLPSLGADPQLLFSATHDRAVHDYVNQIAVCLPDEAVEVWSHCAGYPGAADRGAFAKYLEDHRVTTNLFVSAYPKATLAEVLDGLDLRGRLGDFAAGAQSMSPQQLQTAFRRSGLA